MTREPISRKVPWGGGELMSRASAENSPQHHLHLGRDEIPANQCLSATSQCPEAQKVAARRCPDTKVFCYLSDHETLKKDPATASLPGQAVLVLLLLLATGRHEKTACIRLLVRLVQY